MVMERTTEQLVVENKRQYAALSELSDEVMSMLHARQLREASLDSQTVTGWLRLIYDVVQVGLGAEPHFGGKGEA